MALRSSCLQARLQASLVAVLTTTPVAGLKHMTQLRPLHTTKERLQSLRKDAFHKSSMSVFGQFRQGQNTDAIFDEIAPFLRCGSAADWALFGIALRHGARLTRKAIADIICNSENFFTHLADHCAQFTLLLSEQ
jgi:hypothetical protein